MANLWEVWYIDVHVWIQHCGSFLIMQVLASVFSREITCKCMLNVGSMQCYVGIAFKNILKERTNAKKLVTEVLSRLMHPEK